MAHAMQSDTCRSLDSSGRNYSSGSSAGSLAGHSAGSKTSPSRRKRVSRVNLAVSMRWPLHICLLRDPVDALPPPM